MSFLATLFTNLVCVLGYRCVATNSAATQVMILSIWRLRPSNGISILMRGQVSESLVKSSNTACTLPAFAKGVLQLGVEVHAVGSRHPLCWRGCHRLSAETAAPSPRQRHRLVLSLTMMMNVAFKCEWLVESWALAWIDFIGYGIFGRSTSERMRAI